MRWAGVTIAALLAAIVVGAVWVTAEIDEFTARCDTIGGRIEARFAGMAGKVPFYTYHCWLGDEDITDP